MTSRITRDVLEAYVYCRSEGHLRQIGERGTLSDYEALLDEQRADVRRCAIDRIMTKHTGGAVVRDIQMTSHVLKVGSAFLLDVTLQDDAFLLRFDGLKRVDGPSKLGDFHYVPMLFHDGGSV